MTTRRALLLPIAAAVAILPFPAPAAASRTAEVSIMDDALVLGQSQHHIDHQMTVFRTLGVDRLRVSVLWTGNAPAPDSRTKPPGFNAANPFDPRYRFGPLDRVVSSARAHGLRVLLSITTPAPLWATHNPSHVWRPDPSEFGAFAGAVARRYASVVDQYSIANEPNQRAWLEPQTDSRGLASPHQYRAMVRAAYPRIKAADPSSTVLIGELSSSGNDGHARRKGIRPLAFLRALACVNSQYHPITTGRCAGFRPVPADAIGHHPYNFLGPPGQRSRKRDDAKLGDTRRLLRVLDRLSRGGRIVKPSGGRFNVFYTEFGYQTNPPDRFSGVRLGTQSRYLQQAAYLVWKSPRVRGLNQFRLTDAPLQHQSGLARFGDFQTGLLFRNRRKKPSYRSFPHPFVIAGSRFWGQVRPGGSHRVRLQFRSSRAQAFHTVRRLTTNGVGYFSTRLRRRHGQYRYVFGGQPSGRSQVLTVR